MKQITWIVLGWLAFLTTAQSTSFDCAKAATKVEKTICGNTELSKLDEDLAAAYKGALKDEKQAAPVKQAQKQWMKERNGCSDADCLKIAYQDRIDRLNALVRSKSCYTLAPGMDENGKARPVEPVCQALEKNLNQFCDQPPMACGLKIAPEFRDQIVLPTWTPLDPLVNRALVEEFLHAPSERFRKQDAEAGWKEERPKFEAAFTEKRLTFSQAQLDLYNLGKAQTAYRLDYGDCEANNPQLKDQEKWGWAIHYPSIKIQHAPDVVRLLFKQYFSMDNSTMPEVFIYDGKVYDFAMSGKIDPTEGLPADNWLMVNRHERWNIPGDKKVNLHMANICRFNYRPVQRE